MLLFGVKDQDRVGEERLARLLSERPLTAVDAGPSRRAAPRDLVRVLVINLLVAAVAGTWTVALLLE
jgi:hypothetical protein